MEIWIYSQIEGYNDTTMEQNMCGECGLVCYLLILNVQWNLHIQFAIQSRL